jgi:hypothetical protein
VADAELVGPPYGDASALAKLFGREPGSEVLNRLVADNLEGGS